MATKQIADNKKRVVSIMPKDIVEKLEKIAAANGRSLSNYIAFLAEQEVNNGTGEPK